MESRGNRFITQKEWQNTKVAWRVTKTPNGISNTDSRSQEAKVQVPNSKPTKVELAGKVRMKKSRKARRY